MKIRSYSKLGAIAVIALLAGQVQAITWTGNQGDADWFTGANWDTLVIPSTGDVATVDNSDIVNYDGTNANLNAIRLNDGTLNIQGGYIEATAYTRWYDCYIGGNAGAIGTLNQSGGTAVLGFVEIGRTADRTGAYNLTGGDLSITYISRMSGYHLFIGSNDGLGSGGTGLFEISNDATFTTRYGVYIGVPGGVYTNGTFSVVGSDAEIDIGGYDTNALSGAWYQSEGNTLKLGIDNGGISPITISGGSATIEYGAVIEPYLLPEVATNSLQATWTVMVADGSITDNGMILSDTVDADLWNFGVTNGNEIWVSYGLGGWTAPTTPPAPGSLVSRPTAPYEATLTWEAAPTADSYIVQRSLVSGGPYTQVASGITELTYIDTTPTTDDTYYYVVYGVNGSGDGLVSSEDSAVVIPYTIITYGDPYSELYTVYSAFDNDTGTHYDGETDDAWIGLDFGADNAQQVLGVSFVLRNWGSAVQYATNAQFQGANFPDFSDAVTLHTVAEPLQGNPTWNSYEVTDATAYRYVRLMTAPQLRSKSFAEVKFLTAADFTSNGTPKGWLDAYGLVTGDDYEAADAADIDHDTHEAWQEYIAGTDPGDSNSVLVVNSFSNTTNGLVVSWQSVEGKSYSVMTNLSLTTGTPGVEAAVTGLDGETSYTGTVSGANAVFYEIGVE